MWACGITFVWWCVSKANNVALSIVQLTPKQVAWLKSQQESWCRTFESGSGEVKLNMCIIVGG